MVVAVVDLWVVRWLCGGLWWIWWFGFVVLGILGVLVGLFGVAFGCWLLVSCFVGGLWFAAYLRFCGYLTFV